MSQRVRKRVEEIFGWMKTVGGFQRLLEPRWAGNSLMKWRNGMLTDFQVTSATGTAERDAVPVMVDQAKKRGFHSRTLSGDKNYDTRGCVPAMRQREVTPHVAQNTSGQLSAPDGRTGIGGWTAPAWPGTWWPRPTTRCGWQSCSP